MARTRSIKPSFFKNEDLAECEPMARLLFVGLWTLADRDGRLEHRPLRIKAELFPYDNCDIASLLKQLADKGFVRAYEAGDKRVLEIPKFREHQRCHPDERSEGLPANPCSNVRPIQNLTVSEGDYSENIVFPEKNEEPGNPTREPGNFPSNCALYPSSCIPSTSYPLPSTGSAQSGPAPRASSEPSAAVCWTDGGGWTGITPEDLAAWAVAYPAADIAVELARATEWLKANPKKAKKSNWRKWLTTTWLNGCQDRGGTHRDRAVQPDGRRSAAEAAAEWKKAAEDPEIARRRAEFLAMKSGKAGGAA